MVIFEANRPSLIIGGVVAVLIGVTALVWPTLTARFVIILTGAFLFVEGAFALRSYSFRPYTWSGIAEVVFGMIVATLMLLAPNAAARGVITLIAIGLLLRGAFQLYVAYRRRSEPHARLFFSVTAVVSLVAGALLLVRPEAGVIGMSWLIGILAILTGVSSLTWAFRLRS